ncbi:hypothetical protein BsWGS_01748 [Bradybaena similaris]
MLHQHLVHGQGFTSCSYNLNCTANTNLGIIDLNRASKGSSYQFTDTVTGNTYNWEPCSDFTLYGITAGAMQLEPGKYSIPIGVHRLASCDTTADGFVRFNMKTDNYWFTYVTCICGGGDIFIFESENPNSNVNFQFTSNACCTNYSPPATSSTISPGTMLVIVFFSVLLLYLVLGTVYQVAIRQSQGRDRIPNIALWSSVPGLVKDGFIFTFTCGRRGGYGQV